MTLPKQPKYSFLIDSLNVNPDTFFGCVKEQHKENKYIGWDKMMEEAVKDLTQKNVKIQDLRHYNDEVVKSWGEYVSEHEWKVNESESKSIFNFIKNFAVDCLRVRDGEVIFNIEKLDDWQPVTFHCGEDLFVAALLVDMYYKFGYLPRTFQWDYILKSDFSLLNNLISQNKIVENHYHLGGSAPYVDLSWIYLMNYPFGQTERFKRFNDKSEESLYIAAHSLREGHHSSLENLVKAAAYLRVKLFERCVLKCTTVIKQNAIDDIESLLHGLGVLQQDELQPKIETYRYQSSLFLFGTAVDYAIRDIRVIADEKNSYISGERYLNYCCLNCIYGKPDDTFTQVLFYQYLLIRHHFNKEFIQSNDKTGFQNFKEYNDRKAAFINGTAYDDMANNIAIQGNIQENHISQLEVRIAPNESAIDLERKVNQIDEKAYFRSSRISRQDRIFPNGLTERDPRKNRDGTEFFFFVLHFIKNRDITWCSKDKDAIEIKDGSQSKRKYSVVRQCREFERREVYRNQAEIFKEMRDRADEVCRRIFGIDAASNEVNFRPENFGTVFRFLSNSKIRQDEPWKRKIPDLRKTYHVGEDFYDVVDGLRAIDEAVLFLELSQGDRIGHGVALGIDVDTWYERHPVISLPLQNILDNIAWIRYQVREWGLNIPAHYSDKLETEFNRLYLKLYEEKSPGLLAYMDAWKLRGDDPRCYDKPKPNKNHLKGFTDWGKVRIRDKKAYREIINQQESLDREYGKDQKEHIDMVYTIYHRYHFDEELKKRASKRVEYVFSKDYIEIVKQLQLRMRSRITEKGIAVESCPSSNFLISNLDEFKEIPTFQLFPLKESDNSFRRLNVCINTDDQGVFYTSLVKEYTMLLATMWKEQKDGLREHSDDKILNWIEHLINNGKQLCFRTGEVKSYGIRGDNDLFEVKLVPHSGN